METLMLLATRTSKTHSEGTLVCVRAATEERCWEVACRRYGRGWKLSSLSHLMIEDESARHSYHTSIGLGSTAGLIEMIGRAEKAIEGVGTQRTPQSADKEEASPAAIVKAVIERDQEVPWEERLKWPRCARCRGSGWDPEAYGPAEGNTSVCRRCGGFGKMNPNG